MLEHASWQPFLGNWVIVVYQFRSIADSRLQLLERLRERGCIDFKRGQVVAKVLLTFVCHFADKGKSDVATAIQMACLRPEVIGSFAGHRCLPLQAAKVVASGNRYSIMCSISPQ